MVRVMELLPQVHTWPSAFVCAAYLVYRPEEVVGKRVVEIGSGTGMVAVTAAQLQLNARGGSSHEMGRMVATERHDEQTLHANLREVLEMNGFSTHSSSSVQVLPLSWNSVSSNSGSCENGNLQKSASGAEDLLGPQSPVDLIIGSDVFYSMEDFDPILELVFRMMAQNPNAGETQAAHCNKEEDLSVHCFYS